MSEEQNIKIRRLKLKDRKKLTFLIKKLAAVKNQKEIISLVPKEPSSEESKDVTENEKLDRTAEILSVAFSIMEEIVKCLDDDVTPWFIDLLGCTKAEYEEKDFEVELQIIKAIIESKEFEDFFSKGSQVRKGILGFVSRLKSSNH